eukprot:scaffold481_cov63-Attheya_sp.AAC.6
MPTTLNTRQPRRTGKTHPQTQLGCSNREETRSIVPVLGGNLYQSLPSFEEAYNFYIVHPARDSEPLKGNGLPLDIPSPTGSGGDQGADTLLLEQRESKLFNTAVRSEGLLIDSMTPDNISPQARQALTDVALLGALKAFSSLLLQGTRH